MHIQILKLVTWYVTGLNVSERDPFVDIVVHAGTSGVKLAPKLDRVSSRSINFQKTHLHT